MKPNEIILYGSGGAGRELADNLSRDFFWKVKGFVDDTKPAGVNIESSFTLGGFDYLKKYKGNLAMCIVGNPKVKKELIERIKSQYKDIAFPLVINAESKFSKFIEWGEGSIVAQPFNHVAPGVQIGDFVWVNSFNGIGHDSIIGNYTTIFSGIQMGGGVHIGECCIIGSGATLKPGVKIGNGVIVGAGAVVIKDVPDDVVVVGNPARILRSK